MFSNTYGCLTMISSQNAEPIGRGNRIFGGPIWLLGVVMIVVFVIVGLCWNFQAPSSSSPGPLEQQAVHTGPTVLLEFDTAGAKDDSFCEEARKR